MTATESDAPVWVLGLDIGSASIGWALVDRAGERVAAAGVRIFPAGVEEQEFEKGQPGSSNNTARRSARLQRRQIRRRARRQRSLFLLLQRHGLLPGATDAATPPDKAASPERRNQALTELDQQLAARWRHDPGLASVPAPAQMLPYFLRARGLDARLEPDELGRVLYHLGQRRGFQSNRREAKSEKQAKKQSDADDRSQVKADIETLQQAIEAAGARTLGEYFSRLDPAATKIRRRWTGRKMFKHEFEALWAAQAPHHPALRPALRQRIERLLFYQRPVGAGRVGECELEPGQKRALMASLTAQRFRLLQKLNDLRLVDPDLQEYPLEPAERAALLDALEREGSLTFATIKKRKLVQVPKGYHLNLERGGEKTMPGNQTAAAMRRVFGASWDTMRAGERDAAVNAWLDSSDDEAFAELGRTRFGLSGGALDAWNELELADGFAKLSAAALTKLLPRMEQGEPFMTAKNAEYGDQLSGGTAYDRLPAVVKALPSVPNPAVMRALSELRQLVNAIVREYGKPWEIRVELARDLKRNAKQREKLWAGMRENQKASTKAAARIVAEVRPGEPKPHEILIARLYQQQDGICPYCVQAISFTQAFEAEIAEVDHILPRNRFPDDSFGNKVLAHTRCNRAKSGQTPYDALGRGNEELWDQILTCVKRWKDEDKLRKFQITNQDELDASREDSFAARRLNDTRYTSKLAARYLGELYGGRDVMMPDGTRRQVVFSTSGMATAALRRGWGLEAILGRHNEKGKSRLDHRHHAVDAVVIALTSVKMIQRLSLAAAADASGQGRFSSKSLKAPWPEFVDSIRPVIESIQISHRPSHRLRGALHNDTVYGGGKGGATHAHVRRKVQDLKDLGGIVDARVREAVRDRLGELGTEDCKKLQDNWPLLNGKTPIRHVRVEAEKTLAGLAKIGRGSSERLVSESGNHHLAIFAGKDRRGRDCWEYVIISRLEAMRRKAAGLPVVARQWSGAREELEFVCSLMGGDLVMMTPRGGGSEELFVVRGISENDFTFVRHDRAALLKDLRLAGQLLRIRRIDELRERGCRKVTIDVLGRICEAHD